MYRLFQLLIICTFFISCTTQTSEKPKKVGGAFENNEFIYSGIPENINSTDTSLGWEQGGQKILLTGTVYMLDGKTPAKDVLLYYYHTNTEGRYIHKPEEKISMPPNDKGQTHGHLRGWVKTDSEGKYFIYTIRPGIYPTNDQYAHIHITVKEPNELSEYYIDDFVFEDDPLLTSTIIEKMENRCGNGILTLTENENMYVGNRDLILGLNIPDYPPKR